VPCSPCVCLETRSDSICETEVAMWDSVGYMIGDMEMERESDVVSHTEMAENGIDTNRVVVLMNYGPVHRVRDRELGGLG
jgi:hypothetical protein